MKLYYHPLSGHSHRARLFLSLTDTPCKLILIDLAKSEQKAPEFLALNRFGQLPVLDDEGTVIADSAAILIYIATKRGLTDWLPNDPIGAAAVQRWLSVAAGQIAFGPAAARLITLFGAGFNAAEVIGRAHAVLQHIDAELADKQWIIGSDSPTIADVALYSYIDRAPEGNVDIAPYANVAAWLKRIEGLPGFVPFAQARVGLNAA